MTRKEALAELIAKVEVGEWFPGLAQLSLGSVRNYHNASGAYNGSLDAALALHQAVLPGWAWTVQDNSENRLWPPNDTQAYWDQDGVLVVGNGMPPARAWLLAILKALHEMETEQ